MPVRSKIFAVVAQLGRARNDLLELGGIAAGAVAVAQLTSTWWGVLGAAVVAIAKANISSLERRPPKQ